MRIFTVGHDYTVAFHNDIHLDEWTGKNLAEFTEAMGRPHDFSKSWTIADRTTTEYYWT